MRPEEIVDFIRNHNWTFAKTMPYSPHWYVVKEKCRDPDEFERFVMHIRKNGYRREYKRSNYTSLDVELDGIVHYYWTMGAPLDATIIINRAIKE